MQGIPEEFLSGQGPRQQPKQHLNLFSFFLFLHIYSPDIGRLYVWLKEDGKGILLLAGDLSDKVEGIFCLKLNINEVIFLFKLNIRYKI